ncbi:orotidine-5'-phosphate decarboxylase, partial [Candidatus Aerophobetes bacterium]
MSPCCGREMMEAKERLILALDVDTQAEVETLVEELSDFVGFFKVGHRLFTRYGPKIIEVIKKKGAKVFYDAKFYDISSVVEKAAAVVAELGVDMFTLHTLGGSEMLHAALKA